MSLPGTLSPDAGARIAAVRLTTTAGMRAGGLTFARAAVVGMPD